MLRYVFTVSLVLCAAMPLQLNSAVGDNRRILADAIRDGRDGDLRADWTGMMDVRDRLRPLTGDPSLAPLAHYYLGYMDWRLSALAFVSVGASGQGPLIARGVTELERAIALRPDFPEAQALLATMLTLQLSADRGLAEALVPKIRTAWAGSTTPVVNPRVMLLRAMNQTFAPPPYGDREKGLALWRQAIEAFASDRPAPLMPNWGDAEAYAWLGGAYLIAGQPDQARDPLERAVAMRPDFWWAAKAALPMARRPR